MNCQDIALILDDGDIGRLDPQVRRAAEAHAATCHECAADWQLHARLVHKALPSMPPGLAAGCRALAMRPLRGRHARGRLVVVGGLVALAAAAALLGVYFTQEPEPVVETAAEVQRVDPEPAAVLSIAVAPAPPVASREVTENPAPPAAAASSRFTVRVVQLKNEATSDTGKAAIDTFHRALLEQLRAIPGLVLLMPDDAVSPGTEPDFRLTSRGTGPLNGKEFGGTIEVEILQAGKVTGMTALSFAACDAASSADPGCDPAAQAARMMQMVRSMAFPTDPALIQQQYAALADTSQDHMQRLAALEEIRMSRNTLHAPPGAGGLDDPAVVRAAIELGVSADPAVRARVWRIMGESRSAELIRPLLAALRDQDSDVRIAVIDALGRRHAGEPTVRAALEGTARDDMRPLVRALASRAVTGEESWKQYVGAALRDTGRSEQERVEALVHHFATLRSPPQKFVQDVLKDDETIRALAETLPGWQHQSEEGWSHVWNLLSAVVQSVEHPAIGAMIAEGLQQEGRKVEWLLAADRLLQKGADSRVQAALQKVARDDSNTEARAGAARLLEGARVPVVPAP